MSDQEQEVTELAACFQTVLHSLIGEAGRLQPDAVDDLVASLARRFAEMVHGTAASCIEVGFSAGFDVANEAKGSSRH